MANVFVLSLGRRHGPSTPGTSQAWSSPLSSLALVESRASSPDRGRSFFLELAARQVAVARGLGFRGAYLGGRLNVDRCEQILSSRGRVRPQYWKDTRKRGQLLLHGASSITLKPGDTPGLSSSEVNKALVASLSGAARRRSPPAHAAQLPCEPPGALGRVRSRRPPLFNLGRRF